VPARRAAFALLLAALTLAGCATGDDTIPTFVPPAQSTTAPAASFISRPTYVVTAGTLQEQITARGELAAAQQATLSFSVSGIIKEVSVAAGEEVQEGQVIAALNAPSQQLDLMQRESALTLAQLELARIEARTPETQTLSETSAAYFDLAAARERLALAQALHAFSRAQYEATILTAPFDGILSTFNKVQGSSVTPYEIVGVLADFSAATVQAWLPAESADRVEIGDAAEVQLDGYAGVVYTGAVSAIAGEAAAWQGTLAFPLTVALDANQALPPVAQLGANVVLPGEVHADVPWVPLNALTTVGTQVYLDVLREGSIERVPVQLGITTGQQAEIVSGVAIGDTIVFP